MVLTVVGTLCLQVKQRPHENVGTQAQLDHQKAARASDDNTRLEEEEIIGPPSDF